MNARLFLPALLAGLASASTPARASPGPAAPPAGAPASAAAPAPADDAEGVADTDHEAIRLRVGVGYFGRFDVPLGDPGRRALGDVQPTHLVGLRTWFRRRLGLDVALGGAVRSGPPRTFAWSLRASLPVAVFVEKHLTLFVAPTLGYGQATETVKGEAAINPITGLEATPPDARHTGFRLSAGLRVGAEIHLGFLGMQRLSLLGAVGLDASYLRGATSAAPAPTTKDPNPRATDTRSSEVAVRTTFSEDPWASFIGNVAFVGYF